MKVNDEVVQEVIREASDNCTQLESPEMKEQWITWFTVDFDHMIITCLTEKLVMSVIKPTEVSRVFISIVSVNFF